MPPLPAPDILPNRGVSAFGIDAYPSTTGDVLDVTAEDAWVRNPTPSLVREIDRQPSREITGAEEFGVVGEINEPMLNAEQATLQWGIKDHLKFDQDVPERVAKDLHDLKRDELLRKNILSRAQGGALETIARFGTGLGVSILDPLNVASAFVPVVGQARTASMLARAGESAWARAGARAQIGAVEGLAGAAMLEPIVYGVAKSEQADYDTTDSLLNLAFGTAIGGGFHAGLGRLGDLIRDRGLAEESLRGAVASLVEDRPVSVSTALRAKLLSSADRDLSTVFDELVPEEIRAGRVADGAEPDGRASLSERLALAEKNFEAAQAARESVVAAQAGRAETSRLALEAEQTRIRDAGAKDSEERAALAADLAKAEEIAQLRLTEYEKARDQAQMLREAGVGPSDRKLQRLEAQEEKRKGPWLAAQSKAEAVARRIAEIDSRGDGRAVQMDNFRANQDRRSAAMAEQDAPALRNADAKLAAARSELEAVQAERDTAIREAQQSAMAELRREVADYARKMTRSDEAEVQAIDSILRTPEAKASGGDMTALQADLEAMNKQIGEFRKSGVIPESELKALDEADKMIRQAELRAKATEAAGACEMVRG